MPVVNVNLLIDEKTYLGVMSGALELCGMAKNIENGRIAKHIPTVIDSAKEGAVKAIDIIRTNKKAVLICGGFMIIGGVIYGTVNHFANKEKKKLQVIFADNLQVYLDASKNGNLTIEILDSLINSLDMLSSENPTSSFVLKLPVSQFNELINVIFDFTQRLAAANNINPKSINHPKTFKKNASTSLQYYLNMQKTIFEKAS